MKTKTVNKPKPIDYLADGIIWLAIICIALGVSNWLALLDPLIKKMVH